jgi:hypothetical protein
MIFASMDTWASPSAVAEAFGRVGIFGALVIGGLACLWKFLDALKSKWTK